MTKKIDEYERCDPYDFSKIKGRDGRIWYRIYQQDGSLQDMECRDTYDNRVIVSLIQIHDRWTGASA
jgi:hypothetical protein